MNPTFDDLLRDSGPCVSILLPLDHSAARARSAGSRLRALLRDAAANAAFDAPRAAEISALLRAWDAVADDAAFWKKPGEGVALLSSPQRSTAVWLSEPVQAGLRIGSSFSLLALLRLRGSRPFYVLAVSRKRCRLVRWDREGATLVKVEGMPENIEAAVGTKQPRELQAHSAGRRASDRVVHAGESGEDEKKELRTYLQRIDAALRPRLQREAQAPLVLAGVEATVALYREISHLPQLLADSLTGNFDRSSGRILCTLARPIVERRAAAGMRDELARFAELVRAGLAVTDPETLRTAAPSGGIDTLFVPDPGHVGLLGDSVESMGIDVLRRGGNVHLVASWDMPGGLDGVGVAGILRRGRAA